MTVVENVAAGADPVLPEMATARRAMIDSQLRVSGVNDPDILASFASVAREDHVPAARRAVAYADRAVPLDAGRVLAPALTHGKMLTEAQPAKTDNVLLIGGGSGYLAALLAPLVGSLTVVESDTGLSALAPSRAGTWHAGPITRGWSKGAPYSLIVIDGAVEQLPAGLSAQLADDGRLVTGLVIRGVTRLAAGRKSAGSIVLTTLAEADFAPLGDFAAPKKWSF